MKKVINFFDNINKKYRELFNTKLKYVLNFFPSNIYLLILFVLLLFVITPKIINNKVCVYKVEYPNQFVAIKKEKVAQEINVSKVKRIDEIGIRFSTYMRKNNSIYEVIFYKNDKVLKKEKINSSKIKDNYFEIFELNTKIKKDDRLKFVITPINVKKGNELALSKTEDGNYVYRIYNKSVFYNETIILSICFLILFMFINYLINTGKIKSEEKYYKTMLIYFALFIFVFPPFLTPDSKFHFDRAYTISQNNIINLIKKDNLSKNKQPDNLYCSDYSDKGEYLFEVDDKDKIIDCFKAEKMVSKKKKISISNKIAYLAPGLGIKLAMIFTNSPIIIFYSGRILNALLSFFIILYALKIAPKHKRMLLSLVMIPVFVQQMCSYSYDSLLNSLCVLVIALLLKFFTDDNIRKKDLFIYLIAMLIIYKIKIPYILIGAPIIFINKEKFGEKKYYKYLYLLALAISIGIVFVMTKYFSEPMIQEATSEENRGISINELFNIKHTLRVIYNTVKYNTTFYIKTFFGGLGWLNMTYITDLFIYSYLFFMLLGTSSEKQSIKMKRIIRIMILLINVILIGGIFLAMYLSWTTPDMIAIEGVQGRYLFAPVLCILLCLIPKKNLLEISNETFYSFFNISWLIHLITILYLFY